MDSQNTPSPHTNQSINILPPAVKLFNPTREIRRVHPSFIGFISPMSLPDTGEKVNPREKKLNNTLLYHTTYIVNHMCLHHIILGALLRKHYTIDIIEHDDCFDIAVIGYSRPRDLPSLENLYKTEIFPFARAGFRRLIWLHIDRYKDITNYKIHSFGLCIIQSELSKLLLSRSTPGIYKIVKCYLVMVDGQILPEYSIKLYGGVVEHIFYVPHYFVIKK